MHATRFRPGEGDQDLRVAREQLLAFLAARLDPGRYPAVTLVFDSRQAARRLPSSLTWRHLHVRFARDHASADELIEVMIRRASAPKKLLVVSSDHRLQLAARRRGAPYVESGDWFDSLLAAPATETPASSQPSEKEEAEAMLAAEDWSAFFASALADEESRLDGNNVQEGEPVARADPHADNPFPEGYFDDLQDEFPGEL